MTRILYLAFILLGLNSFGSPINSIVGDQGYERITGKKAIDGMDENLRVKCHLLYVEYLLRNKSVHHLSIDQKVRRHFLLNQLRKYAIKGVFPQNTKYNAERKPCFIDEAERICAVGYLVASSDGQDAAESINANYQYNEISEMDQDLIQEWANKNGFTLEECAMIQPTYEWVPNRQKTIMLAIGSTYRFDANFYSNIVVQYSFNRIFKQNFYSNVGVKYTPLRDKNYSLAVFYEKPFRFRTRFRATVGVGLEHYRFQSRNGFNAIPEVSLGYQYIKGRMVFDSKLAYGYHVNVSKSDYYGVGRNDLSVQIGLGFRI